MNYIVTLNKEIDFAPNTEVAEILQNVRTILSTRKGTVPLDRDFGVSWDFIDKPLPIAKMMHMQAVIEAIEDYEPRVRVQKIEWQNNVLDVVEGALTCRVIVAIGEEENEEEW